MKKFLYALAVIFIASSMLSACRDQSDRGDQHSENDVMRDADEDKNTETVESDYPPMVMIDGLLYRDMGYVNSAVTCGTADGKIKSSVAGSKMPEKDDESNFGEGYEYQFWDGAHVNVNIDGKWVLFEQLAISGLEMPSCVANFKAKVMEASEDRLLVSMTDISDDFKWIFPEERIEVIKPISLTTENLRMEHREKEMEMKDLIGKIVQVWFDGSVKNSEPEMSYPIEPGQIYRITIIQE